MKLIVQSSVVCCLIRIVTQPRVSGQAQKGPNMKRSGAKAADPKSPREVQPQPGQPEKLSVSFEQIQDRAFTKTELLVNILENPPGHSFRHWGLNE